MKLFWFWCKLEILFFLLLNLCSVIIIWLLTKKIESILFLLDYSNFFTLGVGNNENLAFVFRWMLLIVSSVYSTLLAIAIDFKTKVVN